MWYSFSPGMYIHLQNCQYLFYLMKDFFFNCIFAFIFEECKNMYYDITIKKLYPHDWQTWQPWALFSVLSYRFFFWSRKRFIFFFLSFFFIRAGYISVWAVRFLWANEILECCFFIYLQRVSNDWEYINRHIRFDSGCYRWLIKDDVSQMYSIYWDK
jgi:hypothetical protein